MLAYRERKEGKPGPQNNAQVRPAAVSWDEVTGRFARHAPHRLSATITCRKYSDDAGSISEPGIIFLMMEDTVCGCSVVMNQNPSPLAARDFVFCLCTKHISGIIGFDEEVGRKVGEGEKL